LQLKNGDYHLKKWGLISDFLKSGHGVILPRKWGNRNSESVRFVIVSKSKC
jgi:hypothetical protein